MCCLITSVFLLGPRFAAFIWWLINPFRFSAAFSSFIWAILGIIFLPWTTLMYLIVFPGGTVGLDWVWLALAFLADIGMYVGGGYGNRERIPGYAR